MTITSSSLGALLAFGVIFVVVFGGVTLWRRRIPGLALGPSMHAALYLTRYAVALEYYGLRRTEITSHVEALRGDLGAVDATDIDATFRRLGPPRTLAADVTSGTLRPSFLRGAIWFGIAVLLALAISIVVTDAIPRRLRSRRPARRPSELVRHRLRRRSHHGIKRSRLGHRVRRIRAGPAPTAGLHSGCTALAPPQPPQNRVAHLARLTDRNDNARDARALTSPDPTNSTRGPAAGCRRRPCGRRHPQRMAPGSVQL